MANPASGQITLAGIYNEGINGGCLGDAVANFSLSACANGYQISTDPDSMSEFYSKACPATFNYSFFASQEGSPAYLIINKNSVTQVFTYYSGNGSFSIASGDSIYIYTEIDLGKGGPEVATEIYNGAVQVCYYSDGTAYAYCDYSFTAAQQSYSFSISAFEV